jgi:hypothetical protein
MSVTFKAAAGEARKLRAINMTKIYFSDFFIIFSPSFHMPERYGNTRHVLFPV